MNTVKQKIVSLLICLSVMISSFSIAMPVEAAAKNINTLLNSAEPGPQTTGNAALDEVVNYILSQITTPDMTGSQKVQACYDYLVLNGTYDAYAAFYYDCSALAYDYCYYDSEMANAYGMLCTLSGDCYGFSSAFIAMTRVLGYNTYAARGVTSSSKSANGYSNHGWAVMNLEGTEYVFDPDIDYCVYKRNGSNIHCRFGKTYAELPGKYMQYDNAAMNNLFGPNEYHPWILYTPYEAPVCDQSYDNRIVIVLD